jgi:hypothetical protein
LSVCRLAQRSFSSKAHRRTSSATRPPPCPGSGACTRNAMLCHMLHPIPPYGSGAIIHSAAAQPAARSPRSHHLPPQLRQPAQLCHLLLHPVAIILPHLSTLAPSAAPLH